jgi:hypothetical protein
MLAFIRTFQTSHNKFHSLKSQWYLYILSALDFKNPAFCPPTLCVHFIVYHNKQSLFSLQHEDGMVSDIC